MALSNGTVQLVVRDEVSFLSSHGYDRHPRPKLVTAMSNIKRDIDCGWLTFPKRVRIDLVMLCCTFSVSLRLYRLVEHGFGHRYEDC